MIGHILSIRIAHRLNRTILVPLPALAGTPPAPLSGSLSIGSASPTVAILRPPAFKRLNATGEILKTQLLLLQYDIE